jgi:hypothetical protein
VFLGASDAHGAAGPFHNVRGWALGVPFDDAHLILTLSL